MMSTVKLFKKQISFDLDTKKLEKYYPKPHDTVRDDYYKKAYRDIKTFMLDNDFEHRQWSVYVSKEKLYHTEIAFLIKKMVKECPWLDDCVRSFDVTNVGQEYSLLDVLKSEYELLYSPNKAQLVNDDQMMKRQNSSQSNLELDDAWDLEL